MSTPPAQDAEDRAEDPATDGPESADAADSEQTDDVGVDTPETPETPEESEESEPDAEEPAPTDESDADERDDAEPEPEPEPEPEIPFEPLERVPSPDEEVVAAAPASAGGLSTPPGHVEGRAAWRRLLRVGSPRPTKANLLAAILAIALGVGIATQVQLTNERGLDELSQTDLVRVLDDVSLRASRLDQQIRELEASRDKLRSGTDTTAEAIEQAQKRADTLGILAGTLGATGPGITVTIDDPDRGVTGPLVLDLIQELRDAGAEVIEVGGVRVVASSFVGDDGTTITIDGTDINRPIVVRAIGDSNTLASAMTIPGGVVETVRQKGATATVQEEVQVTVTSTHDPREMSFARPEQ